MIKDISTIDKNRYLISIITIESFPVLSFPNFSTILRIFGVVWLNQIVSRLTK